MSDRLPSEPRKPRPNMAPPPVVAFTPDGVVCDFCGYGKSPHNPGCALCLGLRRRWEREHPKGEKP